MSSRVLLAVAILSVGLVRANELAAGWAHSVVVKDGEVWSWGDNRYGQLGQPDSERSIYPRPVPGIKNITAVAASWHTLALTKEGAVYAWGRNDLGQLGNGAYGIGKQSEVPVRVVGLSDVVAIAAGWEHSMALTRSGEVYFWGSRSHGVAGDGSRVTGTPVVVPQKIEALRGVKAIAAGGQHSLALLQDGSVLAWGSNWNGQLGNGKIGKSGHSAVPQPVSDPEWRAALSGIVAIAAGALHSVAVAADGTGYAWGYNGTGQIGDGERGGFWGNAGRTDINRPIITRVNRDKKVPFKSGKLCAAGFEATYILGTDRKIYATGWSVYGEQASGAFGGGNRDHLEAAVTGREVVWHNPPVGTWQPGLVYRYTDLSHKDVTDLEVFDSFKGGAVKISKRGKCGSVQRGTIARNADNIETLATLLTPLQAPAGQPLRCVLSRLMFGSHEGDNDFATQVRLRWTNLKNGQTVEIPISQDEKSGYAVLPQLANVVAMSGGMHHALALDEDGRLWSWGHNAFGQLGNGNESDGAVAMPVADFDRLTVASRPRKAVKRGKVDHKPPRGDYVNVRAHGVKGDGITLDQGALQALIDEQSVRGGGTLWLPPGNYLSGTLFMRSGVRLHLSVGATILAATNRDHFIGKAVIQADDAHDISITGGGVINGRGSFVGARDWRHNCLHFANCSNVVVEGISTINSGSWTQHYIRCFDLIIRDVYVRSLLPARNNDGIDLSGCENVKISGCTVISDDDAIVIKSQTEDRENRNFEVVNNTCYTFCGAFKLGTETRGVYSNIVCRNLTCYGAKALELYSVDGSRVSDLMVDKVRMYDALVAVNIRLGARLRSSYWKNGTSPMVGSLRNFHIKNLKGNVASGAWRDTLLAHNIEDAEWSSSLIRAAADSCISGLPGYLVEDILIEKVNVRVPGGEERVPEAERIGEHPESYPRAGNFGTLPAYGIFTRHARGVTLRKVKFQCEAPDARPHFATYDVSDYRD